MSRDNTNDIIAQNLRFYGEMRFKQLTLLLAWLTIVIAAIVQKGTDSIVLLGVQLKLIIAFASMFICGILWVMEISSTMHWIAQKESYPEIWPSHTKKNKILNASNAVLLLYLVVYGFWYWCAIEWNCGLISIVLGGVFGLLLIYNSIINYKDIWIYNLSK